MIETLTPREQALWLEVYRHAIDVYRELSDPVDAAQKAANIAVIMLRLGVFQLKETCE
jgi:hypothetical protein